MRALDSSILLRYLTEDDSAQTPIAIRFVESELSGEDPGYVSLPVLCETVWTLRRVYRFRAEEVADAIGQLLEAPQLVVAAEQPVRAALKSRGDFVDALIHEIGRAAGCSETVTFDRGFAHRAGVRLLGA
jgi:predicted nucleic-acid-binding protein